MESSSSSGSSKRAKAPANIAQVVSCLVDGCNSNLSQCREYHRRHKVCELHSKTPMVKIEGRERRFCQQCSRFHALEEFDEGKRSCRKRLDGHNRRRRKLQSDSLSRNNGIYYSTQQGTRLLSFNSPHPQILPPNAMMGSSWARPVKNENNGVHFNNYIDKSPNQFQFIQSTNHIIDPNSASVNINFSDGLTRDRALSLLSPVPTQARDIGLGQMCPPHFTGLGPYPFTQEMESKTVGSPDVDSSSGRDNASICFQEMFRNGSDGPSGSGGAQQTLSFGW